MTDELHLLTGFYPEFLYNLGADTLSIVVTNQLGTITYRGPFDPSGSPDYTVVEGTATEAAGIKRTTASAIADGETVLISYVYYENFTVTYQTNLVTSVLQQALDDMAHATANVVAKQAVLTPVDITATVVLKKGVDRTNTDIALRNNLQYLVGTLKLGDPMRRSDVLAEMDNTAGGFLRGGPAHHHGTGTWVPDRAERPHHIVLRRCLPGECVVQHPLGRVAGPPGARRAYLHGRWQHQHVPWGVPGRQRTVPATHGTAEPRDGGQPSLHHRE